MREPFAGGGRDRAPNTGEAFPGIPGFRNRQSAMPELAYERLSPIDHGAGEVIQVAEAVMRDGWQLKSHPPVSLTPPIDWDGVCATNRSWEYHLHSWDGLAPVLAAYDQSRDVDFLDFAVRVVTDWIRAYPSLDTVSDFAWYDMAVGMRAYRLAYLLDMAARHAEIPDGVIATLLESALLHGRALADDGNFPAHSNHGFYVAAGQLALGRRFIWLPEMGAAHAMARKRLLVLIERQFTAEGVHREHSPDYHRMVLDTFAGLVEAGLIEGDEFEEALGRIADVLAWFVLPNGRLLNFGDSDARVMKRAGPAGRYSAALQFVSSRGRVGRPPEEPFRAFPQSGCVVFRDGWPRGPDDFAAGSYLAQTCAFHSRVHKHADDLSVVWYDRGHELLVDGGRYGYLGKTPVGSALWQDGFWYDDPNRVYAESTRAHNTVQIDGHNRPRKGVKPYGSALTRWGERGGVYFAESKVSYARAGWHVRVLLFRPAEWLIVWDRLWDNRKAPHRFDQRFLFAPELEVEPLEGGLSLRSTNWNDSLYMVSLTQANLIAPMRGIREPDMLGWTFREENTIIPCWTSGYSFEGRPSHTFATLFSFGDSVPVPVLERTSVTEAGQASSLCWRTSAAFHTVELRRPDDGDIRVDYRVALPREVGG